jgi:cyclophilin family peptidyl-prolyl cis-trans isomerase
MSNSLVILILVLGLGAGLTLGAGPVASPVPPQTAAEGKPVVVLDTTAGAITIELDRDRAPTTVDNFLKYVDAKFYDGLIFHRVIPGFMIQGGGFDALVQEKEAGKRAPIRNESGNGLSNARGTIAMARTNDPNSATCQFFINHADNPRLDSYGGGYAVFGKVIEGMDVVDKIANGRTTVKSGMRDVPVDPPVIRSARRKP